MSYLQIRCSVLLCSHIAKLDKTVKCCQLHIRAGSSLEGHPDPSELATCKPGGCFFSSAEHDFSKRSDATAQGSASVLQ